MSIKNIQLRENEEYITLGTLLKIAHLISTGGMAKIFLLENKVCVNNEPENRRGRKLYKSDQIRINNDTYLIV